MYELYADLRRTDATEHLTRRIAELFNDEVRKDIHPIRLILDASSQASKKTQIPDRKEIELRLCRVAFVFGLPA